MGLQKIWARLFRRKDPALPPFIKEVNDFAHVKIIRLRGSLDAGVIPQMSRFFKSVKSPRGRYKSIVLDFKKVEAVESSTVAELLELLTLLKRKGERFALMNPPPVLIGTLEILKLKHAFLLLDSEKQAYEQILLWSEDWK
jgi:anti-anti-sigma factor